MRDTFIFIVAEMASIVFACGAIYMAINGVAGWGWMIVASLLTAVSYSSNKGKK